MQERFAYKMRVLRCLSGRMQRLRAQGRHVAIVGDFNIAPTPLDHCDPSPEFAKRSDRRWLSALLSEPHTWRAPRAAACSAPAVMSERLQATAQPQGTDCDAAHRATQCSVCEHLDAVPATALSHMPGDSPADLPGGHHASDSSEAVNPASLPCGGFSDTFRWFHAGRAAAYTCWSTATGARNNNWGTRIDLVLVADPASPPPPLAHAAAARPPPMVSSAARTAPADTGPSQSAQNGAISMQASAGAAWRWRDAAVAADIMPEHRGSDHAPSWLQVDLARMAPLVTPPARAPPLPQSSAALLAANGKQASLARLWSSAPANNRAADGSDALAPGSVAQTAPVKRGARGPPKQARLNGFVSANARPAQAAGVRDTSAATSRNAGAPSAPFARNTSQVLAAQTMANAASRAASVPADVCAAPSLEGADQASAPQQVSAPIAASLPPSQISVQGPLAFTPAQSSDVLRPLPVGATAEGDAVNAAAPHSQAMSAAAAGAGASSQGAACTQVAASQAAAAERWREIQGRFRPIRCGGHGEECVMRQVRHRTTISAICACPRARLTAPISVICVSL